jgi:hypothetical protein
MGPACRMRHVPTVILHTPLRPVGTSAAYQPNKTLGGEWIVVVLDRVEHHLDDALDVAVGRYQPSDLDV